MHECDFLERIGGEWVTVRQEIMTREERDRAFREWFAGEMPESASVLADGRREVRSWEF
jgi:hypothetical protein